MKALNARMMENYRRGFDPTRIVLLLTTTGRKSGLPHVTSLQFEEVKGNSMLPRLESLPGAPGGTRQELVPRSEGNEASRQAWLDWSPNP